MSRVSCPIARPVALSACHEIPRCAAQFGSFLPLNRCSKRCDE